MRSVATFRRAALQARHYKAFARTWLISKAPVETLKRYLFGTGKYPWMVWLRTPTGPIPIHLYGEEDILTLNEIFFRRDYGSASPRVFVDIGANIGIATAFFLSRRSDGIAFAAEPVTANVSRLKENTRHFGDRVRLTEKAISTKGHTMDFLMEPTGRLGGDASASNRMGSIERVDAIPIVDYLEFILAEEGHIDLIKIDTEGTEEALLAAIPVTLQQRIGGVVYETNTTAFPTALRRFVGS